MTDLLTSPIVTTLLSRSPRPPLLVSDIWRTDLTPHIDQLDTTENVRAALHLLNDDFTTCHDLVKERMNEGFADHIHCIAHRREPDYGGARWHSRHITHPHLVDMYLPDAAGASLPDAQKAIREFVTACQKAETSREGVEELEKRQWEELTTLIKLLIEKGY